MNRISLILLTFVLPLSLFAQSADSLRSSPILSLSDESIHPAPHKTWISFERGVLATRILRYDSSFTELGQAYWGGFMPLAFSRHFVDSLVQTRGLILARTRNRTILYELEYASLRLIPLWEPDDIGNVNGLIPVKSRGLILHGPNGVVWVDTGMTPRARLDSRILAEPGLVSSDSLFVLHQDIAGTHALWTEVTTLRRVREVTLGGADGEVITSPWSRPLPSPWEATKGVGIIATAVRSSGFIHTIDADGGKIDRYPLQGRWTRFLSLVRSGSALEDVRPVGIDVGYPGPRLVSSEHEDGHRLHYPLSDPPLGLLSFGRYQLLYTSDSVSLYTSDLQFLNVQKMSVDGSSEAFTLGDEIVLTGETGTWALSVKATSIDWIQRYAQTIALFLAGLLFVVMAILVLERYRRMRAIFRALVTGSGAAGVMIFSKRGRLVRANRQALTLLGLAESTPLGRHILTYFQSPTLEDLRDDIRGHLQNDVPVDRQVVTGDDAQTRTLRVLVRKMSGRYGSHRGTLLAVEDLTESVERDRLLNWATVAHHIAHEMKTPLGTIRTSADVLRGELISTGSNDTALSMLGRIIRQSSRLREIVEDLLTVARSDALVFNRVDLALLVRSIADDMREYLPSSCTIVVESSMDSLTVSADADQLAVALRNVMDNARQAIGSRENGRIACRLLRDADRAIVSISDNGIGMSEETRSRLFQPFYSEKEGGSGIGTTIMKRVVEGHGGSIDVESEPGVGSTFRIVLPIGRGDGDRG